MKLQNMPRMDEADIEDLREKAPMEDVPAEKGDLEMPGSKLPKHNYENPYDPDAIEDIGFDQQPLMRGYGKVQKNLKQWRVR